MSATMTIINNSLGDDITVEPFPFFNLPYELRLRVYDFSLLRSETVDLDPYNYRIFAQPLRLFLVSHRMHDEASRVFYSSNTFRILPIHGRFFHTKAPLLARLPSHYRAHITKLELRLGPGWTNPPSGWVIAENDERLGLQDIRNLRLLKVFVDFDPTSHPSFEGFGFGQEFFVDFSVQLVRRFIAQVPSLVEVELDACQSVAQSSLLLQGIFNEAKANNKKITWGTKRGWEGNPEINLVEVFQHLSLRAP